MLIITTSLYARLLFVAFRRGLITTRTHARGLAIMALTTLATPRSAGHVVITLCRYYWITTSIDNKAV